jgi:glucose 1-dehydrogenase/3-oxoacyl-[acyl-carrier protein] reductase
MNPGKLQGKRALVTGSGTGIGREVALEFARQGADVVIHYAGSRAGAESAAEEITRIGRRCTVIQGNLADVEACFQVVDSAAAFLGGLDVLVNNAGLTETHPFLEITPALFDKLYEINIRGQFFCAQRAARYMLEQSGGAIVNMTSVHGLASLPGYSVYAGTKGAIIAWTRELAIELAPRKIRVNAVAPGWIDVPSDHIKFPDIDLQAGGKQIPLHRVGVPLDVARACAYLASDDSDYIAGCVLVIDGGITARLALDSPEANYGTWENLS